MPQRNVATNFTFEQQRQEINLLAADFWTHKGDTDTAAPTYLKHDGSNAFTGQTLAVPNAFTINSNSGNGTVTISGNLDVTGTTTTVSSANLEVTDKNILIAKGSTSDAQADGAGITIDSATDITFNFVDAKDALVSSIGLEGTTFLKAPYGQFIGSGTPTGGQGVEINAPDTNTGQISSYDRANTAYKELRIKGSSVGIYGGTSNALSGTFNSTGLTMGTGKTITSGNITISTDTDASFFINTTNANGAHLRLQTSGTTKTYLGQASGISGSLGNANDFAIRSAEDIVFSTNNNNTPDVRIDTSGNVSVGTAQTTHTFGITGGSSNQLLVTGTEADIWLTSTGGSSTTWRILGSTAGSTHQFRIYDHTGGADRLTISDTGKVDVTGELGVGSSIGINGSGGSAYPLHVYSGQKYLVGLKNSAANSGNGYPWLVNDSTQGGQNSLIVHFNGIGDRFFVRENGSVSTIGDMQVGTTTVHSGARLTADGNIKLTQATSNTRRIFALPGTNAYALNSSGGCAIGFTRNSNNDDFLIFETHTQGASHAERMRLTHEGYLHLGGVSQGTNKVGGANVTGQDYDPIFKLLTQTQNSWLMQLRSDTATGSNGIFMRAGSGTDDYTMYLTGNDENNKHLLVRGDGYVQKPKNPGFAVQGTPTSSNFTNYNNSWHSFATIHYNNGSHYDNASGRFTAPIDGYYFFSCGLWCSNGDDSTGSYVLTLLRENANGGGDITFAGASHRTQNNQLCCSGGIYMTATQTVRIEFNGSITSSTPRNYFTGCLIG